MIATTQTIASHRDAEQWITDVFPFVQRIAKRHRFYGVEADDIAQEAMIRLYQWFAKKAPESDDECRKMATSCVSRAAGDLYKWHTRKQRDVRRSAGGDVLENHEPEECFDAGHGIEFDELLAQTETPEAYRMRLAGYEVREIAEILGGTESQWRYKMRKQLAKVMQVA